MNPEMMPAAQPHKEVPPMPPLETKHVGGGSVEELLNEEMKKLTPEERHPGSEPLDPKDFEQAN